MKEILGWLSVIFTLSAIGIIAAHYRWVWSNLLQMNEPFTYWFARIAQAHPLFFWGGVGTMAATALLVAYAGQTWERMLGIIWVAFFGWFIPHIIDHTMSNIMGWLKDSGLYRYSLLRLKWIEVK